MSEDNANAKKEEKVYAMPKFIESKSDFIELTASDVQPSAQDKDIDSDAEESEEAGESGYVYKGIETTHTFEAMDQANQLIGGSTIAAGQTEKKKAHYISLEDVDDDDTRELKKYKNYNKDHKIFAFQFPLGTSNSDEINEGPVGSFKTMKPSAEDATTIAIARREKKHELKDKLKRTDSLDSLEELILFEGEKGVNTGRSEALKRTFGVGGLTGTFKHMSYDEQETTEDGYVCSRLRNIWNELEGDVVIMGGYRGSNLAEAKTGRRIWVPIKAGFNMTTADLLIGPNPEDEIKTQKEIVPTGMLSHVGPVDVSKRLIKKIAENPRVHIEDFGYDWRLSLDISARRLRDKLQRNYDKQKEKKGTYVIAHSMGGLVAHKVLQENTNLIRGLIYVGSPSQCSNIIGPFRFGDEVMFNKTLLSKENNFFMRSSFHFLPFDGRCFIDKNTYERYDIDFFDPEVWRKLGLSPLVSEKRQKIAENNKRAQKNAAEKNAINPASTVIKSLGGATKTILNTVPIVNKLNPEKPTERYLEVEMQDDSEFKTPYDVCVKYLKRTLKDTRAYLESLEYRPEKEYPPLGIVYGNKVPTVRGCKVDGIKGIRDGHYNDFYYGPGDGVVHYKWLLPEKRGFPIVCKVASDTGHVSLMTDLDAIGKAFISIRDAEKEREKLKRKHFMSG
ncbi:uncharacterized protein KNAG_0D01350 [Huiozyma naganishii CBS 8797]|uniref:Uncharacterized protein n=1 Tax=Huiozyma naganishii (strain ATCC MYA-139 / BCRC 22969 / CBS 8797 / KCTC 17520 / NBRC 10181 / NCYC 3082 / Yp74L-3) TaxID=1071383 RepID=J7RXQ7_HUIN7|nr:hypothetical protein KNAG_0D01350 [Kazachstania naganishii CBS 8797]CCK69887.1 hypothetical protein KNAG_0D01350 [Kazachstania naganishii CBS 8797]